MHESKWKRPFAPRRPNYSATTTTQACLHLSSALRHYITPGCGKLLKRKNIPSKITGKIFWRHLLDDWTLDLLQPSLEPYYNSFSHICKTLYKTCETLREPYLYVFKKNLFKWCETLKAFLLFSHDLYVVFQIDSKFEASYILQKTWSDVIWQEITAYNRTSTFALKIIVPALRISIF